MAKKKLFKSKTNFTLRRLHQSGGYGSIYERDYTTLTSFPSNTKDLLYVHNGPSFKLTITPGLNGQKKYKHGNWLTNNTDCSGGSKLWTLSCLPEANNTDSKIILKPNSRRLTDFACYGSSYELIKATLTDIISKFPAELYVTTETLKNSKILETDISLKDSDLYKMWGEKNSEVFVTENPFNIDLLQKTIPEDNMASTLRYFCESSHMYTVLHEMDIIADGSIKETEFYKTELQTGTNNCLKNGDYLGCAIFSNAIETVLTIYCYYYENKILYFGDKPNRRIRPNNEVINSFFEGLDDFGKILLNQQTDYTAIFETYTETKEDGWVMLEKKYKWPTDKGDWNLSINGISYNKYLYDLTNLAIGYDMLFTNSIWRDMVHESISNMDLTMVSNGEEKNIDSSKMKQMLNIFGRQFDEIKKYADNIKNTNKITYTQDGNLPDYFLTDNLELSGWETKEILSNIPENIVTNPMYGARTIGYTASDANNDFLRRLKLNSKQILSKKGTKQCIEELLSLFGYHSTDWLRKYYGPIKKCNENNNDCNENLLRKAYVAIEYVYVANGYSFNEKADYICNNVKYLNSLKDNFNGDYESGNHNPYQGLPVVEVNYGDKTRLVPWFDRNEEYDSDFYFQSKGGWARNDGNKNDDQHVSYYDYSITKTHYVPTLNELYNLMLYTIDKFGVYFVGSEQKYYRLKDETNYKNKDGWEEITDETQISSIENIIDNNKGNNPHTGNYDSGLEYYETFGKLFKDSKFNNVRDDETEIKFDYGFNIMRQADSTKCLYFHNKPKKNESNDTDDAKLRGENRIKPYNFFTDENVNYDESASLSVMNSKELHIIFDDKHRNFIEEDILPYLKQIIPSTTIFSYSFEHLTGDDNELFEVRTHGVVCDGETTPIFGII